MKGYYFTSSCLLSVGVLLIGIVISSPLLPSEDNAVRPIPAESSFFTTLSIQEQMWLMNTSLAIHLEGKDKDNENTKPAQRYLNVPKSLQSKILNGEIPPNFQSKFSSWVMETMGDLNEQDVTNLMKGTEVCGSKQCASLPGLGQGCCPFG